MHCSSSVQDFRLFGASIEKYRTVLAKSGRRPVAVIDTEVALPDFERGLARLETRQVFGKVIVNF